MGSAGYCGQLSHYSVVSLRHSGHFYRASYIINIGPFEPDSVLSMNYFYSPNKVKQTSEVYTFRILLMIIFGSWEKMVHFNFYCFSTIICNTLY